MNNKDSSVQNMASWLMKRLPIVAVLRRLPIVAVILLVFVIYVCFNAFEEVDQNSYSRTQQTATTISGKQLSTQNFTSYRPDLSAAVEAARKKTNKFFLDCGANVGSTYKLFHEIWPNPQDYFMMSFEIDPRLKPFYASFENHTAFVPFGVSNEAGAFVAYLEPPLKPNQGSSKSKWGGGSLFTFGASNEWRNLTRQTIVPTFDLSKFISDNFRVDDEIVLKIDIEGAEYNVVEKMLDDGTFKYVDKFYLEFHDWQPTGWPAEKKDDLRSRMKTAGVKYSKWEAEYPVVPDAKTYKPRVLEDFPKSRKCITQPGFVKLAIAVGMNKRRARRLVATIMAHEATQNINLGLFVYRDFAYENPDLVSDWLKDPRFVIGVRGDSPRPEDYFQRMEYNNEIEMVILSSLRQIVKITGTSTKHFLPDFDGNSHWDKLAVKLNLTVPRSKVCVPPRNASKLQSPFFKKRSVEKIPPLLQSVYGDIAKFRGKEPTVILDSDFDESWTSGVFMLDYLGSQFAIEASHSLTGFEHC